jgi:hypothetical protein
VPVYQAPEFDAADPMGYWPLDFVEVSPSGLDYKSIAANRSTQASTIRLKGGPWVAFTGNFTGLRVGCTGAVNNATGNMVHFPVGQGSVIAFPGRNNQHLDLFLFQDTNGYAANYGVGIGTGTCVIASFASEQAARLWAAAGSPGGRYVDNANGTGGSLGVNTGRMCVEDGWMPVCAQVSVNLANVAANALYTVPTGKIFEATFFAANTSSAITSGSTIALYDSAGLVTNLIIPEPIGVYAGANLGIFSGALSVVGTQNTAFSVNVLGGATGTGTLVYTMMGKEREVE